MTVHFFFILLSGLFRDTVVVPRDYSWLVLGALRDARDGCPGSPIELTPGARRVDL